jgi:hypothetical protein
MRVARTALVLLSLLAAAPAFADVTVTIAVTMNGGPVAVNSTAVTSIKGLKSRTDSTVMNQDTSMFVDVEAKQQLMVNHQAREIAPFDVRVMLASAPVTLGEATVSFKPNGQTKEVLGRTCSGYAMESIVPMTVGGETLTMTVSGTAWVAGGGPGVEEFQAYSRAAAAAGLLTSPVSASNPQAGAFAEMQKALAAAGIPYEQEFKISVSGSGDVARMMSQMGAMTMSMKVTAISTDPIPDAKFVLPEGYTRK